MISKKNRREIKEIEKKKKTEKERRRIKKK